MKTKPDEAVDDKRTYINSNGEQQPEFTGLTKREYFAALTMQSLVRCNTNLDMEPYMDIATVGKDAVSYADALIKALNKEDKDAN